MLARVGLEIVLAVATLVFSGFLWPLVKRQSLLKKLVRDQNFLRGLTRDVLSGPLPSGQLYSEANSQGYASNLLLILESDKRTIRRLQLLFGVPLLALLAASYFLGPVYLLINLGISGLLASFPLGESARASAITQVLTIAVILYRWRAENRQETDAFVKQARSLRELYEAVARAAMGTGFGSDASTNTEFQPPAAVGQYRLERVTAQPAEAGGGFQARYRGPDSSYRDVFIYAVMPLGDQAAGETSPRAVRNEIMVLKATFRSQQERGEVSDLRIDNEAEAEARVGGDSVAGYRLALSCRRRTGSTERMYVHVFVYRGHFIKLRITELPAVVTLKEADAFAKAFLRELILRPAGGLDHHDVQLKGAVAVVLAYTRIVRDSKYPPRLADLPYARDRILEALMLLYRLLQRKNARAFIAREYPNEWGQAVLSEAFALGIMGGLKALPEFLSDEEATVVEACLQGKDEPSTTGTIALRAMEIQARVKEERLALIAQAEKLNAE